MLKNNWKNGFKFSQSKITDAGLTKSKRKIFTSIIVAKDGTGDFEDIQDAINNLKINGSILIKDGTYKIKSTLIITKPISINGSGRNTIIDLNSNTIGIDLQIDKISISNLTIKSVDIGDGATGSIGITMEAAGIIKKKILIFNCSFDNLKVGTQTFCNESMIYSNSFNTVLTSIEIIRADGNFAITSNLFNTPLINTTGVLSNGTQVASISGNTGTMQNGYTGHLNDFRLTISGNNFGAGFITLDGLESIVSGNYFYTAIINGNGNAIIGNKIGAPITDNGLGNTIIPNG